MTEFNEEFWKGQLFKYRPVLHPEYNPLHLIEQNKMRFSSPASFNDPFDCKVPIDFSQSSISKLKVYYRNLLLIPSGDHFTTMEANDIVEKDFKQNSREIIENGLAENLRNNIEQYGIFSFSSNHDSILLWSHYADKHRGFCVGFSRKKVFTWLKHKNDKLISDCDTKYFGDIEQIRYPDDNEYPNWDFINCFYLNDGGSIIQNVFLTKSKHWEYESEERIIYIHGANEIVQYPDELIGSVLMGCETQIEHKATIVSILKEKELKNKRHIPLFQARKSKKEFALEFIPEDY